VTVALDATYSLGPVLSGVGVYSRRLIEELVREAPEWKFLLCYRTNRFLQALAQRRPGPNARRCWMEEPWWTPRGVDLFHGLNQRLPARRYRHMVATFHDLFVMSGAYSTPEFRQRFTDLAREAASRAELIVAVSAHTAQQVEQLLGVEPSRLRVVHHGVDAVPRPPAPGPRPPLLLHVGAIQTRKNIARLVEAVETLDVDLVLAGSDGYGAPEIHARIEASPARKRIRCLGYVDRATLDDLYRTAAALVFPSLDEGFGIPVLEAMAAGLPVVTSNRSGTAEAAGDAAVLVDPTDVEAIRAGIERVLGDTADLIRKGRERAAQFPWSRAARETLAVYRELL
jgi:glycosyltransferase involved in cell wall biosynthesis